MSISRLSPNQQLISDDRWPVVGEKTPRTSSEPWSIRTSGLISNALVLTLPQLESLGVESQRIDVHCVTRWSKLEMQFEGVMWTRLLAKLEVSPNARYVIFSSRSERNHTTSLPLDYLNQSGAMIALQANGKPLETIHGGPVRMVVPGRYFYKSIKWLEGIEFAAEDRLGYWEADAGYHNEADPWREQRYIAPNLTKQEAARLIEQRDFRGRDLRGISASGRDLPRLLATGSLLRDADFRRANLQGAVFHQANLSNAHFEQADLRSSDFRDADVEGANFAGADLRGCDFRVASMFGASFGSQNPDNPLEPPAIIDATTRINLESLAALTDEQRTLLETQMKRALEAP